MERGEGIRGARFAPVPSPPPHAPPNALMRRAKCSLTTPTTRDDPSELRPRNNATFYSVPTAIRLDSRFDSNVTSDTRALLIRRVAVGLARMHSPRILIPFRARALLLSLLLHFWKLRNVIPGSSENVSCTARLDVREREESGFKKFTLSDGRADGGIYATRLAAAMADGSRLSCRVNLSIRRMTERSNVRCIESAQRTDATRVARTLRARTNVADRQRSGSRRFVILRSPLHRRMAFAGFPES